MSRYLNDILTKAITENKYNVRNSFELKNILNKTTLQPDDVMVSFDIVSMYEKIPAKLVYKSLQKRWTTIEQHTPIPWNDFRTMVKLCIEDGNYITFDNKFYKQMDGLTIGGSVSGILADFVVTDLLDNAIEKSGFEPTLLVKYVDDTLAFLPKEEMENFFNLLNGEHREIKFTVEVEEDKKIPYLDMMIQRTKELQIITNYYQKETSKNRLLNFNSEHPSTQKTGMAYGTISRILTLTSDINRNTAIDKIYNILTMNNYPHNLIKRLINKFEDKNKNKDKRQDNDKEKWIYRSLSYTPHISESLKQLLTSYDKNLRIGYKPEKTIKKIIKSPYTQTATMDKHNVIYKFKCNDCVGEYIGQTGQKLKNRIKQHKGDHKSKIIKANNTAAFQHSKNTGHTFDFDNTQILKSESNLRKRLILEAININIHKKTTINLKSDIDNLNPSYSQLIENFNNNTHKRLTR